MDENTHRRWDVIAKFVVPLVSVIGLIAGALQFQKQAAAARALELEKIQQNEVVAFRRAIWDEQAKVYERVAEAVGKLTGASADPTAFDEALNEFRSLYWGAMILVEDTAVARAMIRMQVEAEDFREHLSSAERIKVRAEELISACRKSSRGTLLRLGATL